MIQLAHYDTIILGAGAAGMMCASVAGQRGRKVVVIDHADEPGKKILISGGGRCNFTNIHAGADRYLSANPHFAKSALSRYTPQDFLALVERHGIAWHEKTLGQLFCDGSARQIVEMLLSECKAGNVQFALGNPIRSVEYADRLYRVVCGEQIVAAPSLVIATGGPSIPKLGATGFAYDLARQFGLKVVQPRPALVPLTLGSDDTLFRSLSGVSAYVRASYGKTHFEEAALFTHKGLSGPAILQVSSYWQHGQHGQPVQIDFLPDEPANWLLDTKRSEPRLSLKTVLARYLPSRLAEVLCERLGDVRELANMPDTALRDIEKQLSHWPFLPNGTEGFTKAEVTVGGVSTDGLSSKTLEARQQPGLFVIGEAVDVTGWLGGYNFQWAWASAYGAGMAL